MQTLKQFGLRFHHLGLASCREEDSVKFLQGLGYDIGDRIHDPLQNVYLRFCQSEAMPDVEIIMPTDSAGPLDRILNNAETDFYHTCYETSDLESSQQSFKAQGIRVICVSQPKPAVLFDGKYVSFYTVRGFGLLELLESI